MGVAVGFTGQAGLTGVIWDDANPEYNNFTYNNKIQHTHVATKGALLVDMDFWLIPWINDSIAVGYECTDWGKSSLGRAPEKTLNTGLILNHLYTNGLMFNLTYLA